MNPAEVVADLDDKSIKVLRLLLRKERHLNPGVRATLLTPDVKQEYGWTNQTVLRRFRKLRDARLVTLSDVDSTWPEYDRYPRPPKAIERDLDVDLNDLREVINNWDGRGTRSPAQLTDDLDDLDHRIDATDDRLRNQIDALESKLDGTMRQQAESEHARARLAKPAAYLVLGALVASLVVLGGIAFAAPDLLASVLSGVVGGILAIALGTGVMVYIRATTESGSERIR